ncbi:MAG: type II toxin-antitoxin system Phd/YefM family antitoxin [Beutenbergiaceae bacterium]
MKASRPKRLNAALLTAADLAALGVPTSRDAAREALGLRQIPEEAVRAFATAVAGLAWLIAAEQSAGGNGSARVQQPGHRRETDEPLRGSPTLIAIGAPSAVVRSPTRFVHNQGLVTVSVSETRTRFTRVIAAAQHEAVIVKRRGEPDTVVISAAEYARLRDAADELEDIKAFDAAMAEKGPNVPWAQVDAHLQDAG